MWEKSRSFSSSQRMGLGALASLISGPQLIAREKFRELHIDMLEAPGALANHIEYKKYIV